MSLWTLKVLESKISNIYTCGWERRGIGHTNAGPSFPTLHTRTRRAVTEFSVLKALFYKLSKTVRNHPSFSSQK